MNRLMNAAAAVALLTAPITAFAQSYSYAPAYNYAPGYQLNYPAPYPAGSSAWGYRYYYGSSSYPTWQASASSHPAFYGGSGMYSYHPWLGWGY